MSGGGRAFVRTEWEEREGPPVGERCQRCLEELTGGEVFGRCGEKTLCAYCADEEWAGLSGEEKLELLGYEVVK